MKLEFLKNHNGPGGVEEIAPLGSYVSYDGIYCSDMRRVMGYKPCVFTGCKSRRDGTCTVNYMKVVTSNGDSWCLDDSELHHFTIKRSNEIMNQGGIAPV